MLNITLSQDRMLSSLHILGDSLSNGYSEDEDIPPPLESLDTLRTSHSDGSIPELESFEDAEEGEEHEGAVAGLQGTSGSQSTVLTAAEADRPTASISRACEHEQENDAGRIRSTGDGDDADDDNDRTVMEELPPFVTDGRGRVIGTTSSSEEQSLLSRVIGSMFQFL
jgi:hypothetical protein